MATELDIPARIGALWGTTTLPSDAGVLHVVATWFDGQAHRVIRIAPQSPKSETDFFVLSLARARADLILTTGRILRHEPELTYSLPPRWAAGMQRWRAEVLGRTAPPRVAVLTSGRDLDPEHPALHGWATPVIVTTSDATRALASRLPGHVDVIGLESTAPREVIDWARVDGARTISIEAGPSTARALYAEEPLVDELSWSQFLEPELPSSLRGGVLFERAPGTAELRRTAAPLERTENSGQWRFSRFRRRRSQDS